MATMTSDGLAVGTHQGNTDDGEKHRHAQKYDSIHFCIPPFDSQVGVTTKKLPSSHLASNAGEFKEEEPIPPAHRLSPAARQRFPVKLCRLAKI
jgi:hypothetical protein